MLRMRPFSARFTLVELMIVVAIISILAAIAIPNFVSMQYKSKAAEVPLNVDGIKLAMESYNASHDVYPIESTYQPTAAMGKQKRAWETGSGFDVMGWAPDGEVYGSYKYANTASFAMSFACLGDFDAYEVIGRSNVDGDGHVPYYIASPSTMEFCMCNWPTSDGHTPAEVF